MSPWPSPVRGCFRVMPYRRAKTLWGWNILGLVGFYGDLMVFYGDLMGFYGDLMVIHGDLHSGQHTKSYGKPYEWASVLLLTGTNW